MSVPNQNLIVLHRDKVDMSHPRDRFITMYWENFAFAASKLTKSGLMIYMYLAKEIPHFYNTIKNEKRAITKPFEFSPAAIASEMSMARNSAVNGFNDLVDNGFLKLRPGTKNYYDFYELPPEYEDEVWGGFTRLTYNEAHNITPIIQINTEQEAIQQQDEQLRRLSRL